VGEKKKRGGGKWVGLRGEKEGERKRNTFKYI
jgi:hypothetical protein